MTKVEEKALLNTINVMGKRIQHLYQMMGVLSQITRRMEVMQGLSEPPKEWNITTERLVEIAETKGMNMDQAREELIKNFGVLNEKSDEG